MTEPTAPAEVEVVEAGWQVLDPDGNVVDSGPGMFLVAVGDSGPDDTEES